jgi:hypothetical protein
LFHSRGDFHHCLSLNFGSGRNADLRSRDPADKVAPEAAVPASPNRSMNDYTGHGVSQIDPLGLT